MGSADSHRRCTVPIALGKQLAPSFSRLQEPHPQRFVGTHEVIVRTPPLQMGVLFSFLVSRFPLIVHQQASEDVIKRRSCVRSFTRIILSRKGGEAHHGSRMDCRSGHPPQSGP